MAEFQYKPEISVPREQTELLEVPLEFPVEQGPGAVVITPDIDRHHIPVEIPWRPDENEKPRLH